MAKKVHTTYMVHLTSTIRAGDFQDYYYRTEAKANQQVAELREWYKNIATQNITQSSYQWTNI